MTPERSVDALDFDIPREFAHRLLGFHRADRPPRESVLETFEQELEAAAALMEARAVTRLSHAGLPGSDHIDAAHPLAAVVCTIGPGLEERVARLADGGQTARAMILDAIGSSAAEAAADRSNQLLCGRAASAGRAVGRRRSPGYGRWDIGEQRALIAFVETADIGVTLSERCMMAPRKSVSYVAPLLEADDRSASNGERMTEPGDRCARCGLADCPYRYAAVPDCRSDSAADQREAER